MFVIAVVMFSIRDSVVSNLTSQVWAISVRYAAKYFTEYFQVQVIVILFLASEGIMRCFYFG